MWVPTSSGRAPWSPILRLSEIALVEGHAAKYRQSYLIHTVTAVDFIAPRAATVVTAELSETEAMSRPFGAAALALLEREAAGPSRPAHSEVVLL